MTTYTQGHVHQPVKIYSSTSQAHHLVAMHMTFKSLQTTYTYHEIYHTAESQTAWLAFRQHAQLRTKQQGSDSIVYAWVTAAALAVELTAESSAAKSSCRTELSIRTKRTNDKISLLTIYTSVQQRSVKNIRCDSEFHARKRSSGKIYNLLQQNIC